MIHRALAACSALAVAALAGSCTPAPPAPPDAMRVPGFDPHLFLPYELSAEDLELVIDDRELVSLSGSDLWRVDFSFVAYRGYLEEAAVDRATGAAWIPVDSQGEPRILRAPFLITEFPPGSSLSGTSVHEQYGERPAAELGSACAVVDLRGPIVQRLRDFKNPDDLTGAPFRDEEQFAYTMLRSFQESADPTLLWEYRVAEAWLRAIAAVDSVVAGETGLLRSRYLLVGESYGALGAVQAAAMHEQVDGLVICGWPLDWPDLHFTRWRRWEREANYYPLLAIQPIAYRDSRELLSFLFSSFTNPDPACPTCTGAGTTWRAQFNYVDLVRDGRLAHVRTLVLVGDSDPRFPIDLEARASVEPEAVASLPAYPDAPPLPQELEGGPFAGRVRLPFHDLRYLESSSSTIANPQAIEATLAWAQHLNGHRDVPRMRIVESIEDGNVRLDVVMHEGNAPPLHVEVHLTEIEGRHDSDFKHAPHRKRPEPVVWRRFDAIYAGHESQGRSRWKAFFPMRPSLNQAYYVIVRDAVGGLESSHSLPIRPLWNLGDPAFGAAR